MGILSSSGKHSRLKTDFKIINILWHSIHCMKEKLLTDLASLDAVLVVLGPGVVSFSLKLREVSRKDLF